MRIILCTYDTPGVGRRWHILDPRTPPERAFIRHRHTDYTFLCGSSFLSIRATIMSVSGVVGIRKMCEACRMGYACTRYEEVGEET